MAFEGSVRDGDGMVVVDMHGEIDGSADTDLNAVYDEAAAGSPARILFNFDHVTYINSTGIALIVGLLAQARRSGTTIIACGLTDHYKEIFEITRIADFLTIVDDENAAASAAAGS